jgi:DNA-directed RNA polymerase specialized sigma24 family protein
MIRRDLSRLGWPPSHVAELSIDCENRVGRAAERLRWSLSMKPLRHLQRTWKSKADAKALRQAVETLPAGQGQAIMMLKLKEMSLKEASAKSGMSIAPLKVATHRGVKALRKLLKTRTDQP